MINPAHPLVRMANLIDWEEAEKLQIKINNYHRAQQFKRAKKAQSKLKTCLGRLYRDIESQLNWQVQLRPHFQTHLDKVSKLLTQTKTSKTGVSHFVLTSFL